MAPISRISIRVLLGLAVLAAVLGVGLVALTQTQVGRDQIARQLESQFERQYEGSLSVRRLSGNLLWDLYGEDVVLRDPAGRIVLAADSVVLRPRWRSLFSNRLEIRSVELHRPRLDLIHSDEDGWNLGAALRSRHAAAPGDGELDFRAASIRLVDAEVRTRNASARPPVVRDGVLFDYTNAQLGAVHARLRVRAGPRGAHIAVRDLSGELLSQGLPIRRLRGQIEFGDGGAFWGHVLLRLRASTVDAAFRRERGRGLELDLRRARLVASEVRAIVPGLPLDGAASLDLRARGPLEALEVPELRLTSGSSTVRARGRLTGLPRSLAYDLEVRAIALHAHDLRTLLPGALNPAADFGSMRGTAHVTGDVAWSSAVSARASGTVELVSAGGGLRGRLSLVTAPGSPPWLRIDARAAGLDLARLTGEPSLQSDISGRMVYDGRGLRPRDLDGHLRLSLAPSTMFGLTVDGLETDLVASRGRIAGAAVLHGGGALALEGFIDLQTPQADLTIEATAFDLRSVLAGAPATALSGTGAVRASGEQLENLVADLTLALRGSTITLGDSTWALPDEPVALSLRPPGTDAPRLRLESPSLVIQGEGDFAWRDLAAAGEYWLGRAVETTREQLMPRLNGPPPDAAPPPARPAPDVPDQQIRLSLSVLQPAALQPWIRTVEPGASLDLSARFSGNEVLAELEAEADELELGAARLRDARSRLQLRMAGSDDLMGQLSLLLDFASSNLTINGGQPLDAALRLEYDPGARLATVRAHTYRPADSLAATADARVALLEDRYHLLGDFALELPEQQWRVDAGDIDLYTDGLVIRRLVAQRVSSADEERPVLSLEGIASARQQDVLRIHGKALSLEEVLRLTGAELPFNGRAAADLEVAGVLGQPAIVGTAEIEDFTVWGDPAGRMVATSEIIPGREGFDIDLRLTPATPDASIRNDGRLYGSLRLPGRTPEGARDDGFFDLRVALDRLDLFLFDHLFPDIVARSEGGARGHGTITGDWSFPIFHADLQVDDGQTYVPAFNLTIGAAGRVSVDRHGIHLHGTHLTDKLGGTARVDGSILFNEYRFFSFDLRGAFHEFELIDVDRSRAGTLPFYGHIRGSGSATLTGPMDNVFVHSPDAVTTPDSRLFIPVTAQAPAPDAGFLVFTDAAGRLPEPEVRRSLIGERPGSERPFLEGLEMMLNVRAPQGSTVHLVFDPVIGDVINTVGSGTLQLAILEGEFQVFGTFEVERGDYLFTAGEVFTRRFELERGGTLTWEGDPVDARMNLPASYRTRASLAGLGLGAAEERQRVPFVVRLLVGGRVTTPLVELSLALDEAGGRTLAVAEALRRRLNEPDRQAEYATSVLLTNTFLLAPSERPITEAADDLLFTSLSELVSTRLNLFLNQALGTENIEVALGVQQGTGVQDFDLTYGVALRLLDQRLIIRGEGVYHQLENTPAYEALQGEVVVELRLSNDVSVEVFYRREGDLLMGSGIAGALTAAYGAGVNYQAEFTGWRRLLERFFRRAAHETEEIPPGAQTVTAVGDP